MWSNFFIWFIVVKSSHYFFWFGLVWLSVVKALKQVSALLRTVQSSSCTSLFAPTLLRSIRTAICANFIVQIICANNLHFIICPNTTLGSIRTAIPTVQTALSKSNHVSTCPYYIVQTICTELHSLALGAALSPFPILCHRNLTDKLVQLGQTLLLLVFAALVGASQHLFALLALPPMQSSLAVSLTQLPQLTTFCLSVSWTPLE